MKLIINILTLLLLNITFYAQNVYDIPVGSKNNEIEFEVKNSLDRQVKNLIVQPVNLPDWIEITSQSEVTGSLEAGASTNVKFLFNIKENAKVNDKAALTFYFNDAKNAFEQKSVTFRVSAPKEFKLEQNYPNPFNPITTIKYQLPEKAEVKLFVYDIIGREVTQLVSGEKEPGIYEVEFDASKYASGLYIYRFISNNHIITKKMLLLK